ncbi:unnamed protein product, partial [Schistosoma rodhaini]
MSVVSTIKHFIIINTYVFRDAFKLFDCTNNLTLLRFRPQLITSTTDHITTEGIISQTENVTHPILTVQDVYRIGNETK